jgi:hypothetical protein
MKKLSGGKTLAVVAAMGGAVLASVMPVMADVSSDSPAAGTVKTESPAKIKAWGAAVEITVTYNCPTSSGLTSSLSVDINQAVFGGLAKGFANKTVPCTNKTETTTITATAQDKAFIWGKAYVRAGLYTNPYSAHDEREITFQP